MALSRLLPLLLVVILASRPSLALNDWNFSTNPCSGKWSGICCSDSPRSCCPNIKFNPDDTSCVGSTAENATIVVVSLDSNYRGQRRLNGTISDSICNLTSLLQLDLNNNNLTGRIPTCIGDKLTQLTVLGLAGGNLDGNIPPQFGKLTRLKMMYLDNNNLSGDIPSSLGAIRSLEQLYLRGNRLSGQIPPSLGNLTSLTDLELQVNQLNGSIPVSFSNFKNVTIFKLFDNQLSGDLNASVFQAMSGLTSLNLRRNRFTGPVPALGSELASLKQLDLGFNELSGTIPATLGTLPAISELYLGHNNLSGDIPSSFSTMKNSLDVSHNILTGTLENLPLSSSLDFSFNSFDTRNPPSALLQQGQQVSYFNCNPLGNSSSCIRSSPGKFSSFGVATGGPVTTNNGTRFEADAILNTTGFSYFGMDQNWALEVSGSSAGTFKYPGIASRIQDVPPEDGPALYQFMRWSSSYMAYHGGGLENGGYTVTLYFAETVFLYSGFRVFDVLLQGVVVEKDLDVAGRFGAFRACKIQKNTNVTDGTLSIEFIYTGKDRYLNTYSLSSSGPMVSAIFVKSLNPTPGSKPSWRIVTIATIFSFLAMVLLVWIICYRNSNRKQRRNDGSLRWSSRAKSVGLKSYTYKELSNATHGFSDYSKLGQGAFGKVYMGTINGRFMAIKQLLTRTQQSKEAFRKEMEILSSVQHRNLLSIIGYCVDADYPMLVCDYMQNGSLDKLLYNGKLTWEQRKNIAIGTALGLAYLHDESKDKIVHCDVKPPNILLDEDLNPRIGDFGMARLCDEGRSHITATKLGGTIGYLAPEYAMHYQLSDKADVYSFGVVLLELISGRKPIQNGVEQVVLVEWAQNLASNGTGELLKLMDPRLEDEDFPKQELVNVAGIALHCIQEPASSRPIMRNVWLMLTGMVDIPPLQVSMLKMDTLKALIHSYAQTTQSSSQEGLILFQAR